MKTRYKRSEELLTRALSLIPGGTQTFSKSYTQYPLGVSPFYAGKGEGSKLTDIDGNQFIDFVSGLLAVNLGYKDPHVTEAVINQISTGVTLSLPMPLEVDLSERIIDMIPCAERVRFCKNGSDATAAAVRVARGFSGRKLIVVCGYHGWQDWYIGTTTRDLGIPDEVKRLTMTFPFNDLDALESLFKEHPKDIAAVIMEPSNMIAPVDGFLSGVRALTEKNGALLIFDEIITGFRFARGGGQELYGVTPDLCALGKGLANGYPLAAVAGRATVMQVFEKTFFSATQGSEALSLAASMATLDKIETLPVIDTLAERGERLRRGVGVLITKYQLEDFVSISGHPSWTFLNLIGVNEISPWEIKTLYMQECMDRGILCLGTHNLNYAHSEGDIDSLISVYDEVFPILRDAVDNRNVKDYLRCKPLEPLFKIR